MKLNPHLNKEDLIDKKEFNENLSQKTDVIFEDLLTNKGTHDGDKVVVFINEMFS